MGDNGSQVIDRVSVAWLEKQGIGVRNEKNVKTRSPSLGVCNSILYGIFTDRSIFRHWSLWFQWDLNSPQIQSTHAGDTFQARIGIWKGWFLRRGENRSTRRKTSRSREENQQQTQPTYDGGSGIRTRDTLVGGEHSHHCAIPAPQQTILWVDYINNS